MMSALPIFGWEISYPEKCQLGAKFLNVCAHLHPICLSYLTYIYIYNIGSSTAAATVARQHSNKDVGHFAGHIRQSPEIIAKYRDQPPFSGWALPIPLGRKLSKSDKFCEVAA